MNPSIETMPDVQSSRDHREIPIDQVGVSDLRYPVVVLDQEQQEQHVTGHFSISVDLPKEFKGTHMSRFVEVLNKHRGEITMRTLPTILADLRQRLDAERSRIELNFQYFLERQAPVSGLSGLMDYGCTFIGELDSESEDFILGVQVPVTSLCPCSKEISDYGAHNQRGHVTLQIRSGLDEAGQRQFVWIEELVDIVEASASSPLYPLLKRSDERHVTMAAYDNPVFVEDMVRNVATRLQGDERIVWFEVHAVNMESIHNHNAFAKIEWTRPDGK